MIEKTYYGMLMSALVELHVAYPSFSISQGPAMRMVFGHVALSKMEGAAYHRQILRKCIG